APVSTFAGKLYNSKSGKSTVSFQPIVASDIRKLAVLRFDSHLFIHCGLHPSHDPGLDAERFGYCNDVSGNFFGHVQFHPMPHIEDFVHLLPIGAGFFLDQLEKRRNREKVVLDDMERLDEMEYLGLRTATAVDHPVNLTMEFVQHGL